MGRQETGMMELHDIALQRMNIALQKSSPYQLSRHKARECCILSICQCPASGA